MKKMERYIKKETNIEGLLVIENHSFEDQRGFFMETYNKREFEKLGILNDFVQDNHSKSSKGVLRGLHFQKNYSQAKLVRVIKGKVYDVAVDLRKDSKTYGKYYGIELTENNKLQFFIPKGFAHGFMVLSDTAEFVYKCDEFYHPEDESGIIWNDENINISISQKGGHVIYMNTNREVNSEIISQEEATEKGKNFLAEKGFPNMQETYYVTQEGVTTINYAYVQDDVIAYPDLIKVKIALDNGDILGIETTGYLNNHTERDVSNVQISSEKAKENLNSKLEITSERLAIIPTEWKSEILCYEFTGNVDDKQFLVYINAENGREEDILVVTDTGSGILVH